MEDVGILVEVVGVWARVSDSFANQNVADKHSMPATTAI